MHTFYQHFNRLTNKLIYMGIEWAQHSITVWDHRGVGVAPTLLWVCWCILYVYYMRTFHRNFNRPPNYWFIWTLGGIYTYIICPDPGATAWVSTVLSIVSGKVVMCGCRIWQKQEPLIKDVVKPFHRLVLCQRLVFVFLCVSLIQSWGWWSLRSYRYRRHDWLSCWSII